MKVIRLVMVALFVLAGACRDPKPSKPAGEVSPRPEDDRVIISVIGTNDIHGNLKLMPILGGYLDNLRAARADDGGVVLVDGGDMFQGTLESNAVEGASMIEVFEALGYTAATVGNHEFDFGPVGPAATPENRGDDPQGALRQRIAEADFPILTANVVDARTGKIPAWDRLAASAVVTVAKVKVAVIGVTTMSTPRTTIADNFAGLAMVELATAIEREATRLRARGVDVIIVAAHAGGRCHKFHDPHDHGSCEAGAEIFEVARALPSGLVDVIVAGHTHAGVAHRVNGIAIIESFSNGRAFGRVDLVVRDGAIKESLIFPPRFLCGADWRPSSGPCEPRAYEGKKVLPSAPVTAVVDAAMARTRAARERSLGVELADKFRRSYSEESALGNLFTDLMLAARPKVDAALTNGGGLRADLAAGPLTYGELYEAMPFDNRFAFVTLTGAQLAELMAANLGSDRGIFSLSGVSVRARCAGKKLVVDLYRAGTDIKIGRSERLTVATSDFLAAGGDGVFARLNLPEGAIRRESGGETIRDAMAAMLEKRNGKLQSAEVFDPENPRLRYPGERPVSCD